MLRGQNNTARQKLARLFLVSMVSTLVLTACSLKRSGGGYYKDDGPPTSSRVDLSQIADAKPRKESLSATGNQPYKVNGKKYYPLNASEGFRQRGLASWYGKKFHGKRTSTGEVYNMYGMTAAHPVLPIPSYVRVKNLRNQREVVVRVNDRGPFLNNRIIDLSYAAASKLDIIRTGTGLVEVVAITENHKSVNNVVPVPEKNVKVGEPKMYIQAGAFVSRFNAEQLREQLIAAGFSPVIVQQAQGNAGPVYRVRVGPLSTIELADSELARLNKIGLVTPALVIE